MSPASPTVVVVGDAVTDVTVLLASDAVAGASDTPARITSGGGGGGANAAAWLRAAGVAVGLVARVGDDDPGRVLVDRMRRDGVQVAVAADPVHATGTVVALVAPGGERTMLTDRGAARMLQADDLPAQWFAAGRHLHVSGYALFERPGRAAARAALRRADACGMTVSVDPASWAPLRRMGVELFRTLTAGPRLWLPNLDEARLLTGADDPVVAARRLARDGGTAVVTCGPHGAVWSDGRAVFRVGPPAAAVVDTTGAGDAFAAGYLAAHLRGADADRALHRATALAGMAISRVGGRPAP